MYLCLDDHDNQNKDITIRPCCARVSTKTKVSDDDEYHDFKSPFVFVLHWHLQEIISSEFAKVYVDFTKLTVSRRIEREILQNRKFNCLQNNKITKVTKIYDQYSTNINDKVEKTLFL